ncbi:MAG: 5-carboxymethyl-2-hydroxymuconate isomerase family protein [Burkholderia sp.]|jgi:5-carboxymethyl-2-hydroxymuconate isomerase|nr:5-carboxymethyl-2-hydroxymuconate isomerase family protein [Burkholderia sp.]
MPHITVEVPAPLARKIEWRKCFLQMHQTLSAHGYGRLEDFKSRVIVTDEWLVADKDPSATFIFATLQTMNPRSSEVLRAMAKVVHERLEHEAKNVAGNDWVQCCVKVENTPAEDYFKSHLNAPALKEGLFKVGEN